ncbi:MAG: ribulose-phosphate 3-epimerase [Erysipelotrichaceae bacterium]
MKETIIAPSILSLDYSRVSEQLEILMDSEAKWLHFDVMDGHFVPNLTFGPDILKGFKKKTEMFMDVHIMVDNPQYFADVFVDAGADLLTFHLEACADKKAARDLCEKIHEKKALAGISLKPKTSVEEVLPLLDVVDVVLIMSVEPGFGGQSFMSEMLDKVRTLKNEIKRRNLNCLIEIDGGINLETGKQSIAAGCDILVAGSYIFKQDIKEAIAKLK